MADQKDLDNAHMKSAYNYAALSRCVRRKVGAVITRGDQILSYGWNGTPPGWDNICENEDGKTKPHVRHAEQNALKKIMRSINSSEGGTLYVTTSPCEDCAVDIFEAGIKKVFYVEEYHNINGLNILRDNGVEVTKLEMNNDTK